MAAGIQCAKMPCHAHNTHQETISATVQTKWGHTGGKEVPHLPTPTQYVVNTLY